MLETLKKTRLFEGRPESELQSLLFLGRERRLSTGETLYHAGQEGQLLYLLLEGSLRRIPSMQARWVEGPGEQTLQAGTLVGTALLTGGVYRATVVAAQPSRLLAFELETLRKLPPSIMWLQEAIEALEYKARFADQIIGWLRHTALFRGLPPRELEKVMARMQLEHITAGTLVMRQGDPASSLGLIVRGEGRMVLELANRRRVEVATLTEGDLFGESGLLLSGTREVSLEAVTPLTLLRLTRQEVLNLSEEAPLLLQTLLGRLNAGAQSPGWRQGQAVALIGHQRGLGRTTLALQFAARLSSASCRVAVLETVAPWQPPQLRQLLKLRPSSEKPGGLSFGLDPLGAWQGVEIFELERPQRAQAAYLREVVGDLKQRFDVVILDTPALSLSGADGVSGLLEECAWCFQLTLRPEVERLPSGVVTGEVVRLVPEWPGTSLPYLGRDILRLPWEPETARLWRQELRPWHLRSAPGMLSRLVGRLGRLTQQKQVGLALSGGGNWGFSHIGVLQVLEENRIPVDMVSGTSCGSFIGGLYAAGHSGREIERILLEEAYPNFLKQVTPSVFLRDGGLVKADSFERFLKGIFRGRELTQLELPFWPNAMDAASGEEVVFRQGPVYQSVTAAASLPGLFAPYTYQGRVLLDGGLINNLPLGVLHELGSNISIGVNCIPHLHPGSFPDPPPALSHILPAREKVAMTHARLTSLAGPIFAPVTALSTLNMAMRGIQMLCHKVGEESGRQADIYLAPDVSGAQWFEFHKVREMIAAGRRCAERALPRLIEVCGQEEVRNLYTRT